ncbi:MAG: tRNA (adenosine(37)-N6)-dimethylallyltransferase MiaA [Deltaproteobacteria bacterium RBG_16_66_15]|nr:MAG: tRNA (adenosine(37)-N6)-dimethylallyltransferase MiaA [Deltaproteobacteria bacterium GWA2_65_63]OGP80071.1 MAG: tRNA (adenosine(37)-N6)-dimethylallyltransferase MiaA [Deltaproteobacteria bacterium RBG_16_66_15]
MTPDRIIVLSGPTASGKSGLALALAREFPVEIVNADSLQVYRYLDIGTAKPTVPERREVPHHLIDVADPDEAYDAGRYVREAERAIGEIRSRGKVPLVAGGTGMYIRALLRGLDPLPADPRVREELSRRWESEGGAALHAELARIDPETAARVHPSDRLRVVRAMEIAAVAGIPPSRARAAWRSAGAGRGRLFLALRPDRETVYRRIDARTEEMFRRGLTEEVRGLLARGFDRSLKPMMALGYRHTVAHLLDGVPLPETIDAVKRDTRRYAKRQLTWLSSEPNLVHIVPGDEPRRTGEIVRIYLS